MSEYHHYLIRPFAKSDFDSIKQLHEHLFPVSYSDAFIQMLFSPSYLSLLLVDVQEDNSQIVVGVSTVRRSWESYLSTQKDGYLSTFGIRDTYRRKHLASDLLTITQKILHNYYRIDTFTLHVQENNESARLLYEKSGFESIEYLPRYYRLEKNPGAFLMKTHLDKVELPECRNQIELHPYFQKMLESQETLPWYSRFLNNP